jgi:cytochrome c553
MKRTVAFALVLASLLAATPALAQRVQPKDPEDAPELYPAHPKRDDAFYACVACHSFKIVAQQGMSRDRWDESLTWMTNRHKMPALEGKDREAVLDYLAEIFPERRQPGGWVNPFAPK